MKKKQNEHQLTMEKILRSASKNEFVQKDRLYAQKQLKKIYSQELSRIINEKKYNLLFDKNREQIENRFQHQVSKKIQSIHRLQEKSLQRRSKIIKDRLKTYQNHDKQWALKTEEIKHKVKIEEQSMIKTAEEYRIRSETEWKQRRSEQTTKMRQFSSKYHILFNSKHHTERSQERQFEDSMFNRSKLQELLKKRKSQFKTVKKTSEIQKSIENHRKKQLSLSESRSKEQLEKLMNKMEKMEKIEIKRIERVKTESIERAKNKLNQKKYQNNKPQIGPPCLKHESKQENFRKNTFDRLSTNRFRSSPLYESSLRHSFSIESPLKTKQQKNWEEYCQKTRRIKISRLLKTNIRSVLNAQFKNPQMKTQLSQC